MGNFEIKENFYLDGKPFQIISGAIHYFRIVPEYWQDRLEKLKAMGCNTVETYIPWNMHEPKKGEFHFEGMLDIERFIKTAQDLGQCHLDKDYTKNSVYRNMYPVLFL